MKALHVFTVLSALVLCSCVRFDPDYSQGIRNVTDTNFPPGKVHGVWVLFIHNPMLYATQGDESKVYYQFNPGGAGVEVQHTRYVDNGRTYTFQTPLRWRYDGGNVWQVMVADSTQARIIERSPGMDAHITPFAAAHFRLRYGDGKLYHTGFRQVMVPKSEADRYFRERRARQAQAARKPLLIQAP